MRRPLDPRRVELWCTFLEDIEAQSRWPEYLSMCDARERERAARMRLPGARRRHLAARALVRTALSHYAPITPEAWTFGADAHGRPRIVAPEPPQPIEFNIAHSAGLVVVGVSAGRPVGVDVEHVRRRTDTVALERYFAPVERTALAALAAEPRRARFFELWTLKESYLKARGVGLRLPLAGCAFELSSAGRVHLSFTEAFEDVASRWAFAQFTLRDQYMIAVCAERQRSSTLELVVLETVPLAWTRQVTPTITRAVGIDTP